MRVRQTNANPFDGRCVAESDARYGAFDFRTAYEEAPDDLREVLDNYESLVRERSKRVFARFTCAVSLALPKKRLRARWNAEDAR